MIHSGSSLAMLYEAISTCFRCLTKLEAHLFVQFKLVFLENRSGFLYLYDFYNIDFYNMKLL
jgi:hypothetical protein